MANNNPEILDAAIELVRAGRKEEARQLFQRLIREDPKREIVWLWFVETLPDPAMRVAALRECLRHNPGSQHARDGLSLLGASVQPGGAPKPAAPPKLPPAVQPPPSYPPLPAALKAMENPPQPAKPPRGKTPAGPKPPAKAPPPRRASRRGPPPAFAAGQPKPARGRSCLVRLLMLLSALGLAGVILAVWLVATNPGLQTAVVDTLADYTNIGRLIQAHTAASGTPRAVSQGTPQSGKTPSPQVKSTSTPTVTPAPTRTATPTITFTPTVTGTPTLFAGDPLDGEAQILLLSKTGCQAMQVPLSGGGPLMLEPEPIANCDEAWISPDETRLAYIDPVDQHAIRIVNLDGSGGKEITRIKDVPGLVRTIWSLDWSPDGKMVAFQAASPTDPECGNLYVIPSAGSNFPKTVKTRCLSASLANRMVWSPDSQWIFAFDKASAADPSLYPFAFREKDSRAIQIALLDVGLPDARYAWSPDSLSIAHIAQLPDRNVPATIVITDLDEAVRYVDLKTDKFDAVSGPVWNPEGSLFLLFDLRIHKLIRMDLNGIMQGVLLPLDRAPSLMRWSPDGEWLAVLEPGSSAGDGATLLVVRADGSESRILAYGVNPADLVWR